ncbi:CmcJ/NvfI family oxidoreductase [Dongia deserti]|uniref:CmcJ/NvfI family oxidoreductase n=1 Tax=Dongia deserti TaxID=2268030 RepID=UPI000E64D032|nr:CmcJ/NvfI family oxidoreductase [Dongia deserti]
MNQISPKRARVETHPSGYVLATMNYTRSGGPKPAVYMYDRPAGVPPIEERHEPHQVAIHSARPILETLSLDLQGFALTHERTAVRNFDDPDELKRIYDAEVADLVLSRTGARTALVFDHTIRRIGGDDASASRRAPVHVVHNDYTAKSGPQRVRDLLPPHEAEQALKRRFAIVNVWRSINGPVSDTPLAFADARTVADEDWIATDLKYPDRTGEVYRVAFNPAHRWFYVPNLQPEEILLLKTYDSDRNGRARYMPHSAFNDPATAPGTAKRQSIESRVLAFF